MKAGFYRLFYFSEVVQTLKQNFCLILIKYV
jgi:hypothetical protein